MIRRKEQQVVVTGVGVLAANGTGIVPFWESLLEGRTGIAPLTLFDAADLPSQIGGEVKGFDPHQHIKAPAKPKRMARQTQFAVAATNMALEDASFEPAAHLNGQPFYVVFGVSQSAFDLFAHKERSNKKVAQETPSASAGVNTSPHSVTLAVASSLNVACHSTTISTNCLAGLEAIAQAADMVRQGQVDYALAGGTDSPLSKKPFVDMVAAGLNSFRNDEPESASCPFDARRDTGVLAEGAGVVLLENLDHALARGAKPYLKITGFASGMDHPGVERAMGLKETMKLALANAGKRLEDVDYICAHGPGHPVIDQSETQAIKQTFGELAYKIPVGSIKGVTGNPLSAAGPQQLITCAKAFTEGMIPPTANYKMPDTMCDLDYITDGPRYTHLRCALINSHGYGGSNSSLVVERV